MTLSTRITKFQILAMHTLKNKTVTVYKKFNVKLTKKKIKEVVQFDSHSSNQSST